jgi:polyphosphate kinase
MFPIEAPDLKERVLKEVIPTYLRDNQRARQLMPDGTYVRLGAQPGETPHRSQEEFLAMRAELSERAAAATANGDAKDGTLAGRALARGPAQAGP